MGKLAESISAIIGFVFLFLWIRFIVNLARRFIKGIKMYKFMHKDLNKESDKVAQIDDEDLNISDEDRRALYESM